MAQYMMGNGRLDVGRMRPWIHPRTGQVYITSYRGGDPNKPASYVNVPIQTNATLRRDEWIRLDEVVLQISETRLNGIQDLISNGLTFDLGNAMGTTVLEYHTVSDAMEAALTMDGVTRSVGDRPNFETAYLPLPIIHVDYEINARVLAASRNMGNPLDTTSAERAARKVAAQLETMLFTATSYTYGGGTIYSYLNEPDRNLGSLTGAWNTPLTGAQILTDVLAMKQSSISALHYGPWSLYVPTDYETTLDGDYDATTPGTTIRERILKVSGINEVKVIDTLTAGSVLLVQMTSDVVRLVRGLGMQNVEWETEGKMITKYKVMTIQVPQVRSDQAGNSGVTHYSV
jgi:uncharacterized linocin/CFP29 family protein